VEFINYKIVLFLNFSTLLSKLDNTKLNFYIIYKNSNKKEARDGDKEEHKSQEEQQSQSNKNKSQKIRLQIKENYKKI